MDNFFKIIFRVKKKRVRRVRKIPKDYKIYKKKALEIVNERIVFFNQFYGYRWNNIVIRNQKTRWGSCSKKGNLNFNYKIALLPSEVADYIIVHELCHLGEFNHSENFWNLVAKTIPDYKEIRKNLKNNKYKLSPTPGVGETFQFKSK